MLSNNHDYNFIFHEKTLLIDILRVHFILFCNKKKIMKDCQGKKRNVHVWTTNNQLKNILIKIYK